MGFRFPHPAETIGDAVRDVFNPDTPADGSLVTQLMNENNRAIEDALGGITPTPPPPDPTGIGAVVTIEVDYTDDDIGTGGVLALNTLNATGLWIIEVAYRVTYTGLSSGFGMTAGVGFGGTAAPASNPGDTILTAVAGGSVLLSARTWIYTSSNTLTCAPDIYPPSGTGVSYSTQSASFRAVRVRKYVVPPS